MKKIIGIVFFLSLALVITSCNQSNNSDQLSQKPDQILEETTISEGKIDSEDKTSENSISSSEDEPIEEGIYPGMKAPDFTLLDRNDQEISLSDYTGKIVFLNFWATTCPYCVDEMPDLEKFYNTHKDDSDVALLGINMTKTWEKKSKDKLVEWLDGQGITFPVVFDETGDIAEQWMAHSLPVTFIITKEGISLGAIMGKTDIETLEGILEEVRGNI